MPTVTGFEPITDLGNNRKGLKKAPRSISRANITGEDFSNGLPVTVKYAAKQNPSNNSRYWVGLLSQNDNGDGYRADLECLLGTPPENSDAKVDDSVIDPEEVTVTVVVGTSDELPSTINIGP